MRSTCSHRFSHAFTLIEVVLAISILGFGILAISGLFGLSLSMQGEAVTRSAASRQLSNWFALTRSAPPQIAWTQQAWEDGSVASPIPDFDAMRRLSEDSTTNLGPFWLSREGTPKNKSEAISRLDLEFSSVNSNAFFVWAQLTWPAQSDSPRVRVQTATFLTDRTWFP